MKKPFNAIFCFLAICCTSCGGYHAANLPSSERLHVNVPLIHIDDNGILRDALAYELANSGKFIYTSSQNSRYQLKVRSVRDATETVGYSWDRDPRTDKRLNVLYPMEGRRNMTLKVSLFDTHTKKTVGQSFKVSSHSDYDYSNPTAPKWIYFTDKAGQRQTTLTYSYGQIDSEEGAKAESYVPLFKALAEEIVYLLAQQQLSMNS